MIDCPIDCYRVTLSNSTSGLNSFMSIYLFLPRCLSYESIGSRSVVREEIQYQIGCLLLWSGCLGDINSKRSLERI